MKKAADKHLTLREKILETIRDDILTGVLKPGGKVPEPELAERFGISRTPIREAFRQLESEGYLTVIPRRGAVVVSFSAADIREFYAIKGILEGFAARHACERLTERELDRLKSVNDRLRTLAESGDVKQFFKIHNDFHEMFIRASGNDTLFDLIASLVKRFQRLRIASLSYPGRMLRSVTEHDKIIEAFRSRSVELAEKLVRENAEDSGWLLMGNGEPLAPVAAPPFSPDPIP